jgi:hypothetical protein
MPIGLEKKLLKELDKVSKIEKEKKKMQKGKKRNELPF